MSFLPYCFILLEQSLLHYQRLPDIILNGKVAEYSFIDAYNDDIPYLLLGSPLKRQSPLQQTTNFVTSFLIFEKNKV